MYHNITKDMAYQAKTVAQYTLDGNLLTRFPSAHAASKAVETTPSFIISCCRGHHKRGKGFVWKYDPDYEIENFFQDLYSEGGKTIEEHPNYIIFENGRVYSKLTHRYLKPSTHRDGYLTVKLYQGEEKKEKFIHVLVAQSFIPKIKGKEKVNHKDGIKTNNHVDNLEWETSSGNTEHAHRTGLIKKYNKPVVQYTKDGEYVKTYPSVKEAAATIGVGKEHFSAVCNGKYKTCQGFVFKFQDEKKVKDNPDEIWKEIEGYPKYEVSNLGRVYSQKTNQIRKILNREGRQTITIGQVSLQVHTLVAIAFLDKPKSKKPLIVNHKDGEPHNNHVENLEWITVKGNNEHALETGLKKVKQIEQYTLDREYIKTFPSTKVAMIELGVCHKSLWVASHGYEDNRTCKGFRLKVIE